ncbi:MAG: hypothetical protein Q4G10_00895 [Bacteroidia bacterium]|nr:hypothetical protein [Bacteroidia bacterium]
MKGRVVIFLIQAAVLIGCSRPVSSENFVRIEDKGVDGRYHFAIDMTDSLCTYDVYFYSRIDCGSAKLAQIRDFPMMVTWVSPSGQKFEERVYFDVHAETDDSGYYSKNFKILYRSGLVPVSPGEWEMQVRIDSDRYVPGFRGLGVICKKNLD